MRGTTSERWKPVTLPGFEESHEVSSLGRVRTAGGRVLAQYRDDRGAGYMRVSLVGNGRRQMVRVHRLVTEAFLGPLPPGLETLHGPGGSLDNRLANLSYGTHRQNIRDKLRDGTEALGERSSLAKLTADQIRSIRAAYAAGADRGELAALYSVDRSNIARIVTGDTWSHLLKEGVG